MDGAAQEYERRISRQGHAVEGEAMAKGAMQERASVLTQIENEVSQSVYMLKLIRKGVGLHPYIHMI